jgi:membrane fusion protein (multidrug efflux system)
MYASLDEAIPDFLQTQPLTLPASSPISIEPNGSVQMKCPSSGAPSRVKRMETQEIASRSQGNPALLEGELLDFEDTEPAVASGTSKRRPDVPGEPSPKWTKRRVLLTAAVVAALAGGAYYGSYWWTVGRFLVSTDDAYVKADLSVISAKVAGNITAVPTKENAAVQAGDTLAQIDDRDYKIAVEAARNKLGTQEATIQRLRQQAVAQEALIDQAKAQVLSTKASLVRAMADFDRAQTLAKQEFGSQQRLDQALAERDQARAAVKAAEAAQASAEANLAVLNAQVREAEGVRAELQTSLDKALLDLSYTTVKAAFAGIVGNKAVQVGQYVQPGTRLLALVPPDTAYVEANYKETQLDHIRPGQPADVAVDAADGRVYHGIVESIAPASGSQYSLLPPENATGNFTKIVQRVPVRIRVNGDAIREGTLRPGLSVVTSVNTKGAGKPGGASAAPANPE